MNKLIETIFKGEITEKGLTALKKEFPEDLKLDMSDDIEFKAARKKKTDRNKLVKAINERRIGITSELKGYGDSIIQQINEIYDVVVLPFEKEDKKRKEIAAKVEAEKAEALALEKIEISKISLLFDSVVGKSSEEISAVIEAVDMIDVEIFSKDLIHEAMVVKRATLEKLSALLISTKQRAEIEAQQKDFDEKNKASLIAAQVSDRINKLKMIPTTMFGKGSPVLKSKIESIKKVSILEVDFFDRTQEAKDAAVVVISQLSTMLQQQILVEASIPPQAEYRVEIKDDQAPPTHQKAEVSNVQAATKNSQENIVKEFLRDSNNDGKHLVDFGYLLISKDENHQREAVSNLRQSFSEYRTDRRI